MAEWSIAAVLKTVGCKSPVGSNPTSSILWFRAGIGIQGSLRNCCLGVRLPPKLLTVRKPKTRGRCLQSNSYLVEVQAAPPLLGRSFNGRKSRLHRDNGSSILPRSTNLTKDSSMAEQPAEDGRIVVQFHFLRLL